MEKPFDDTIEDMHRLAARIGEMLATPGGCGGVPPYRLRLARAHALALADELRELDDAADARGLAVTA